LPRSGAVTTYKTSAVNPAVDRNLRYSLKTHSIRISWVVSRAVSIFRALTQSIFKTQWVDETQRIVGDIRIPIPTLGIGKINRAQARRIRRNPASLRRIQFAKWSVISSRDRILRIAGEVAASSVSVIAVRFSERGEGSIVVARPRAQVRCEAGAA
jgi:hypothetical protein